MFISRTFSLSSSSFSTITSAVLAFSERSMKRFKCSERTFAAKLIASSGAKAPFVNTSIGNLLVPITDSYAVNVRPAAAHPVL